MTSWTSISQSVSRIGFGGASISGEGRGYGFGSIDASDAETLIHSAIDFGISLFDLAPIYGFGVAEERVGQAIRGATRDKVRLVTKGGVTWDQNQRVDINNSPEVIQKMLENSLQRLDVDVIDTYLIHWPDPRHDIRFAYEVLVRAKEEGKVKSIGLSNTFEEDLCKCEEIGPVEVVQGVYNIFNRSAVETIFPLLRERKIGFMGWGTLDKGVATGRVHRKRQFKDRNDARSWATWWKKEDREWKFQAMERVSERIQNSPFSLLQVALGSSLSHPEMQHSLVGARTLEQLSGLIEALKQLPTAQAMQELHAEVDAFKEA